MIATSKHNKYVSIPDWFSSSSSNPSASETTTGVSTTTISVGGSSGSGNVGGGGGSTEIPIDNRTIVWIGSLLSVPIDEDKIIIKDGKITTSAASDFWELKETESGSYIYTTYPIVTQQGITMYADEGDLDLPSIYDGLPIDNMTIYWALDDNGNKVLKSIGQSGGGVADSVAWVNVVGKPSWLLDDKIQYTEIEGTPDLSGFITKAYVDDNFVTFNLDEEISGIKTFTNGLKIGNSSINQSQEDVIYVDANLVVRGGVTIYADTGDIDIPSLIDSLPIAGYDTVGARGIASFDSSYFSVTNGIVTLIPDNVGLNETKLVEYLTNNNYAKKSDIPSLSGYATQSWVESKGYALNSELTALSTKVNDFLEGSDTDTIINKWLELETFLSGLSESDNLATILGNKANSSDLANYIPISGYTDVLGEKNFTGGLKVNGSPITYDSTNKYWKLEGDLLVTGGVTTYGNDSDFTPSTIMDALVVDNTTLKVVDGVLKFVGSVDGGVASSVAWSAITGKPSWITTATPTITISGTSVALGGSITQSALRTALGLGSNAYTSTAYLPLSGGTITASGIPLIINRTGYTVSAIHYQADGTNVGRIGVGTDNNPKFMKAANGTWYNIWHSGNDGSGSGLNADLLDGKHYSDIINGNVASATRINAYQHNTGTKMIISGSRTDNTFLRSLYDDGWGLRLTRYTVSGGTEDNYIATLSSNVASATKLQTARSIWGQSFNGAADITGRLLLPNTTAISSIMTDGSECRLMYLNSSNVLSIGYDVSKGGGITKINGDNIQFAYGTTSTIGMILNASGNLTIGASNLASTSVKLYVSGATKTTGNFIFGGEIYRPIPSGGTYKPFRIIQNDNYALIQVSSNDGTSANGVLQITGGLNNSLSQFKVLAGTSYISGKMGLGVLDPTEKLHVAGNILATGGVTMYSMRSLKNVVDERGLSLEELSVIKPTRYTWKDGRDNKLHIGGIADDVMKVLPEVVYKTEGDVLTMDYGNAAFAIASSLINPMIEHERNIKVLQERVKELEEKIKQLKAA